LRGILPVVAEIAKLPNRVPLNGRGNLAHGTAGRALALVEESVDSLRTSLVLPDARKDTQVLAVASAVHGEGKTTIASQLAVSIARSTGERTLLIDADMRSPDVHHVFQVPLEPGLCKVLDGRCSLDDAIVTTWSDHVHLLPAGLLHKSPHFLIGKGSFGSLLHELRQRYRYIVVDTPPVLSASEALVVAKHVDEVVICAMSGRSREHQVRLAHSRLVAAGIRPVGGVLSAVDVHHYASTYGSYAYTTHAPGE
jgi:capsular exopolysaccharide synthesis family protein